MSSDDPSGAPAWTVLGILQWTNAYFQRHQIDSPRSDAELLLAHALRCERIDLYLRHDQPLNPSELARFKPMVQRRVRREPVAYIVGFKEFWSMRLQVSPAVLIPRPDTECLVETALDQLRVLAESRSARVLELGVGSGAITLALASECATHDYWATDFSLPAIQVAQVNARHLGLAERISFVLGHWLAPFSTQRADFDMILSNPPYIRRHDIDDLAPEIRGFEPHGALDGGIDGLDAIRQIIDRSHACLRPGGRLLIEIGFDQREAVESLALESGAYDAIDFRKDYSGHDRVARMTKKGVWNTT
jgi:release factor glutamine methyltransferase